MCGLLIIYAYLFNSLLFLLEFISVVCGLLIVYVYLTIRYFYFIIILPYLFYLLIYPILFFVVVSSDCRCIHLLINLLTFIHYSHSLHFPLYVRGLSLDSTDLEDTLRSLSVFLTSE